MRRPAFPGRLVAETVDHSVPARLVFFDDNVLPKWDSDDPALPRDIVRHELPESERVCDHDGHALVEIGAEVSEQMHVIPEQVRVLQHHRIKYACPCCDLSLNVAPTPARIIPRGLLTEEAQAWVITGKYQFGMPLYRTAVLLRRFGGDIVSNTLAAGVVRIGLAVQPIINLLRDHLLDSDLIYGDASTSSRLACSSWMLRPSRLCPTTRRLAKSEINSDITCPRSCTWVRSLSPRRARRKGVDYCALTVIVGGPFPN